jgi:hypothetical protein
MIKRLLGTVYNYAVRNVLRSLYIHGPRINVFGADVGFWAGAAEHDICAALTHTSSEMWHMNSVYCSELIEKTVFSYEIAFAVLMYVLFVRNMVKLLGYTVKNALESRAQMLERALCYS